MERSIYSRTTKYVAVLDRSQARSSKNDEVQGIFSIFNLCEKLLTLPVTFLATLPLACLLAMD